jgi:uncharacterized protein
LSILQQLGEEAVGELGGCATLVRREAKEVRQQPCGTTLTADPAIQVARTAVVDESACTTAVAAHLSTFAGLIVPFGSVIGPLAVWLTRRDRDPFIDQAGREALNFGITIAIYGSLLLAAALMLVGIPFLIIGVVTWVVLASLAAVKPARARPSGIR